jgi:hypothetical protein
MDAAGVRILVAALVAVGGGPGERWAVGWPPSVDAGRVSWRDAPLGCRSGICDAEDRQQRDIAVHAVQERLGHVGTDQSLSYTSA